MKYIKILIAICLLLTHISKSQIAVYGAVEHIVPDGVDTQGNIVQTVSGSTAPYSYTWNPGSINTKDISSITAGHYTVNILSASSQTRSAFYKVGYKTIWTNTYRAYFRNDSLFSGNSASTLWATGTSKNTLPANTDGWFEYVMTNLSSNQHWIGFSDSLSPNINYSDIDYGVYYNGTARDLFSIVGNGATNTAITTNLNIGDVIRIDRTGDVIKYFLNNVAIKTMTVTGVGAKTLKLKACLSGTNVFRNVGCSFINFGNATIANYVKVIPYIKHNTDSSSNNGLIKVTPSINFTNTYSWTPGGTTSNSITSLSNGIFNLTVKDSLDNQSSRQFRTSYKANWSNLYYCYFRNDTLISATGYSNKYTTAVTKNTLKSNQNGWFEYILTYKYLDCYIGLTDSIAPHQTIGDIDYGFLVDNSNGYLYYYESGVSNVLTNYLNLGDILSIERVGNSIFYKQNGVTIRTVTSASIGTKTYKLKCNMYGAMRITDVGCSFLDKDSTVMNNYVGMRPFIVHSSGPSISDGSLKVTPKISFSNTYSWAPVGAITSSISSLSSGSYSVAITDSLKNRSVHNLNIGYKVNWTNLHRCVFRNDSLLGSAPGNLLSTAHSKETLKPFEDGWFEFVLENVGANAGYIGFSDSLSPNIGHLSLSDIDFGFYYQGSGSFIHYYQSGSVGVLYTIPQAGDRFRMERVGNTMYFKINGAIVRTVTSSGLGAKALKIKVNLENTNRFCYVGSSFYEKDSTSFINYVQVTPLIKHSSGAGTNDGSIYVKPKISGSVTYNWPSLSVTTATANNLPIGKYNVVVTDSLLNNSPISYNVGYKTIWKNIASGFFRNDTLKSTASSSGYNYGCTRNVLNSNTDGWFEYVITSLSPTYNQYIGFVDSSANNSTIFNDIQYGFLYTGASSGKYIYSCEGGSGTAALVTAPRVGDILRLERVGNSIYYKVNGQILRTITNVAIGPKVFKLKAKLQNTTYLTHIGMSVPGCILTANAGPDQLLVPPGSVTLGGSPSATGTPSSFSYTWTPNFYLSSTSVANPIATPTANTIYTLAINNYPGCTVYDQVEIFTRQNEDYVKLFSSLNGGYYTIPSSNKLFFTLDGEYEQTGLNFTVYYNANHTAVAGLTTSSSVINNGDNRYYMNVSGLASDYYILEVQNQKKEKLYLRFKK